MRKFAAVFFLIAACASPLTEDQKYHRDNMLIERTRIFKEQTKACQDEGGSMIVDRSGPPTHKLSVYAMGSAYCSII